MTFTGKSGAAAGPGTTGGPPATGLTSAEAQVRLRNDGPNELPSRPRPPLAVELVRRLLEPLNLALVIAGTLTLLLLDETLQGATIVGVAVVNAAIGGILERRADDATRQLSKLVDPLARVVRDGAITRCPAREIVVGDVVHIAAGDRVPADLEVVEAADLQIDESMLTGESLGVHHEGGSPVWSGTQVMSGTATGRVTATGGATRLGAIAGMLDARAPKTPLQRRLARLTARLGIASVLIGMLAAFTTYLRTAGAPHRFGEAVLVGVALAIAAVPEGLPTAITSALAFSGLRLARRGAIVRSLTALEGLGTTTVLCSDKTGTLTTGSLRVLDVVGDDTDALWLAALRCNDAERTGDQVDAALLAGAPPADRLLGERALTIPFDATRRAMTTVHRRDDGTSVITMKGAPEAVWHRCAPGDTVDALSLRSSELSDAGAKVLAFASASPAAVEGDPDVSSIEGAELDAIGLIAFGDPLRESAPDAIAAARAQGLRVVMVTGDHPGTAQAIAGAAGMDITPIVTGDQLALLEDPDDRAALLAGAAIVARVDPAVKLELIDAHRASGEVVAMTGDGVNDAPALQHADIGIAVGGVDATEVARHAAALVLGDGDLSTIVRALEHGRQIHRNLRATIAYLLTGNLSEIFVILGSLAVFPSLATPLLPVQLLWVNLLTDTIPALALGIDDRPLGSHGAPRPSTEMLGRSDWTLLVRRALLLAASVVASAAATHGSSTRAQIVASLVCCHLVLAYVARSDVFAMERGWWRNRTLLITTAVGILVQVAVFLLPATRRLLEIASLPATAWLRVAAAVTAFVVIEPIISLRWRPGRTRSRRR